MHTFSKDSTIFMHPPYFTAKQNPKFLLDCVDWMWEANILAENHSARVKVILCVWYVVEGAGGGVSGAREEESSLVTGKIKFTFRVST